MNEGQSPLDRVTFQVISNTKSREYVKMMEAQTWTEGDEGDGLVGFCMVYGFKQSSIQKLRSIDHYVAAGNIYRERPLSPAANQNYGRKHDRLTRAIANMVFRGCAKRSWEVPTCCEKPSGDFVTLLGQLADVIEHGQSTVDCVISILLAQPVRADSPVDEFGEGLEGHTVADLYLRERKGPPANFSRQ